MVLAKRESYSSAIWLGRVSLCRVAFGCKLKRNAEGAGVLEIRLVGCSSVRHVG